MGDGINDTYASIGEWRDPNTTKPTEQECLAEWEVYLVEKAAEDAEEQQVAENETTARTGWRDLGDWATWTPQEAELGVRNLIFDGANLADLETWVSSSITGTNVTQLRTQLIAALMIIVREIVTVRTVLSIVAKVIMYIRDILIKKL